MEAFYYVFGFFSGVVSVLIGVFLGFNCGYEKALKEVRRKLGDCLQG